LLTGGVERRRVLKVEHVLQRIGELVAARHRCG
jgi:hypothetical protein